VSSGIFIANEYSQGFVKIGCEIHSIEEWDSSIEKILTPHNTPKERIALYLLFIQAVKEKQKHFPINK